MARKLKSHCATPLLIPLLTLILCLALGLPRPDSASAFLGAKDKKDLDVSDQVNIMLVLDASGSMWGQVGGKAKIEIAKESLTAVINELPDTVNAGLVAYGHRRKGDCADVEELVPLGPIDKALLIDRVKELNPKGKTPITLSIQIIAEMLKGVEGKTTILLVSDGKETCYGDPCDLVRELREQGIDFVMDVIGFDVTAEERAQLECMAEAGGGKYYSAANAEEFMAAAQQSSRNAGRSSLMVTVTRNNEPIQAYVEVLDQQNNVLAGNTAFGETPARFSLEPGEYAIRVTDTAAANKPTITAKAVVEKGKTTETVVEFNAGTLKILPKRNGQSIDASAVVLDDQGREVIKTIAGKQGEAIVFYLPAGVYSVEVTDYTGSGSPSQVLAELAIEPGQEIIREVEFGTGTLEVTATFAGKPLKVQVYAYPEGSTSFILSEKTDARGVANLPLPAGNYDLKVTPDQLETSLPEQSAKAAIQPEQTTSLSLDFPGGVIEVNVTKGGAPFEAEVQIMQAGVIRIIDSEASKGGTVSFILPPGDYDVVCEDRTGEYPYTEKRSDGVVLESGATLQFQFAF